MRILLAAAFLVGVTFTAPESFAAPVTGAGKQMEEAAPVENYITRGERCRPQRRGGRVAVVQRCEGNAGVAAPAAYDSECAPRVAYRGHRRVLLAMRECRPLFDV